MSSCSLDYKESKIYTQCEARKGRPIWDSLFFFNDDHVQAQDFFKAVHQIKENPLIGFSVPQGGGGGGGARISHICDGSA